tara:strand:+ start:303 stop:431 length:129 start_codon:yes stop_codon:yes gene_type:complete
MLPEEIDDLFGKSDPKSKRALPFILVGFGLIAAWAAYLFFFQ